MQALTELRLEYRQVLELGIVRGLSHGEIAKDTGKIESPASEHQTDRVRHAQTSRQHSDQRGNEEQETQL